jgi:hypothetical protein
MVSGPDRHDKCLCRFGPRREGVRKLCQRIMQFVSHVCSFTQGVGARIGGLRQSRHRAIGEGQSPAK